MDTTAPHRVEALDGLRAVAFIAVVVFHAFEMWHGERLPGAWQYLNAFGLAAWVGVDLFFVLSGFLITGILLRTRDAQHRAGSFYARRALRIFPLYYLFLAALFAALAWHEGSVAGWFTWRRLSFWVDLQNLPIALAGWDTYRPLSHLWTLAVEEQFYLVWPWVVWWLSPRALHRVIAALVVLPLLARVALVASGQPSVTAYVATWTRIDTMAAGAAIAAALAHPVARDWLQRHGRQLLAVGAAAVLALFLARKGYRLADPLVQTLGYTLNAWVFAAVIAVFALGKAGPHATPAARWPLLRWVGQRSYAGYLFHWPLTLAVSAGLHDAGVQPAAGLAATFALVLPLTLLCAELSWRLLEGRMMKAKDRFPAGAWGGPAAGGLPESIATR